MRKAPSALYWFGTDEVGRDILSRIIYGARASLMAGVISVGIAIAVGVPVGLVAGYAGGLVDGIISRFTDAMLACPFLILAIALAAFLGPSLGNAMIAIGVTATPIFVRLTRGQVLSVKAEDYVEAARAIGNPPWRIAFRHILPNVLPQLLVQATLTIATAIIAEASLSFLGLGQQPPAPSWGSMLNAAQRFLTTAPWMAVWPGVGDLHHRPVVQPSRRRPARRARPAREIAGLQASHASSASPATTQRLTTATAPTRLRGSFSIRSAFRRCSARTSGGMRRISTQSPIGTRMSSSTSPSTGMKSGMRSIGLST